MGSTWRLDYGQYWREHLCSDDQLNWSPAEKKIARKAFDRALHQELESLIREAKEKAERIAEPSDVWDLVDFLTERRKQIVKYDYRYSVLPEVFGYLIAEGRLTEEDLRGVGEDKLEFTRRLVNGLLNFMQS